MRTILFPLLLLCLHSICYGQSSKSNVPPEMGGEGFEDIAEKNGWKTGGFTDDQIPYIIDTNAIRGGEITFALGDFPTTLRVMGIDENSEATRMITNLVYEPLISVNPFNYDFLPYLASHWKVGEDGQTYWFRINPDARFSDGHPVTTEDVIATYKLGIDEGILSPYTNSFYLGYDAPVAISPYIFYVRSKEKNWKSMVYFGGMSVLPAHVIKSFSGKEYLIRFNYDMPTGSDPYRVKRNDIKKGASITITRNLNWWGKDDPMNRGFFNFDTVVITILPNSGYIKPLRSNSIDFAVVGLSWDWRNSFKFDEVNRGLLQKRKVFTDDAVGFGGLAFNTRRSPLDDENIREALIRLFNKKAILKNHLFNEYILNNSFFPNSPYENVNNPTYDYNPTIANQLLDKAGYKERNSEGVRIKDSKPLILDFSTYQSTKYLVDEYYQECLNAGIQLNFIFSDGETYSLLSKYDYDIAWMNWGGLIFPNPISSFHSNLRNKPHTNNITGIQNPRIDELCSLELQTFDNSQRIKIIQEIDSILVASKHYALSWYAPFTRIVYWNKFGHPKWYLGKINDYKSIITSWWIDPKKAAVVEQGRKDKTIRMPKENEEVRFWIEYNQQHKRE